jgi:uncharacterized Zn finger protein (UPF0148 family)
MIDRKADHHHFVPTDTTIGHDACPACGGVLLWAHGTLICPRPACPSKDKP